jgi:hypothetical protein
MGLLLLSALAALAAGFGACRTEGGGVTGTSVVDPETIPLTTVATVDGEVTTVVTGP